MSMERMGMPPPWVDVATLIQELRANTAATSALVNALASLTGIMPSPDAQNLTAAINNLIAALGTGGSIDVQPVLAKMDTLIALGKNTGSIQIYNARVTDVTRDVVLPTWAIPDGKPLLIIAPLANVGNLSLYSPADRTQLDTLTPGTFRSLRLTSLVGLKIIGNTLGDVATLLSEKG